MEEATDSLQETYRTVIDVLKTLNFNSENRRRNDNPWREGQGTITQVRTLKNNKEVEKKKT